MKNKIKQALTFVKKDIWHIKLSRKPPLQAFLLRSLRILILTSHDFIKGTIQQGASALTYYTLLAAVPLITFLLGIARGFLFEQTFENWVKSQFPEQKQVVEQFFQFASLSLKNVTQGVFAGISLFLLVWSGIKIFIYIERIMNQIWEVSEGRPLAKKFSDYLALLFICPIIALITSGLTVTLSSKMSFTGTPEFIQKGIHYLSYILLHLIPFLLTSLLFCFLYIFMPNERVRFLPALYAGLIAGCTYQIFQLVFFYLQIYAIKYNPLFGTLAALPFLLIWLHLSWVIVLLGAKITYSIQNVDGYEFNIDDIVLSQRCKKILSLQVMHHCVQKFCSGHAPPSRVEISNLFSISLHTTSQILVDLIQAGLLSEVKRENDQEASFQPARSTDQLTIKQVTDMMEARGEEIPLTHTKELRLIIKSLEQFDHLIEHSNANMLLKDLS